MRVFKGVRLTAGTRHRKQSEPKLAPRGRHCASHGCQVLLSVYNPGDHCHTHAAEPR